MQALPGWPYFLAVFLLTNPLHAQFLQRYDPMNSRPKNPPAFSANPTLKEVLHYPQESFASLTSENKPVVLAMARRLATRADAEVAALIPADVQSTVALNALHFISRNTEEPKDLAFMRQFFEAWGDTVPSNTPLPNMQTLIQQQSGITFESERAVLLGIAYSAMEFYGHAARRLNLDEAAVPVLLRKLDHEDYNVAGAAARSLQELQSPSAVAAIDTRLREVEGTFPLGPWDQKIVDDVIVTGVRDRRFGKAGIYLNTLGMMKTAEARAAAWAALARWEAIYQNHPDRDKYLAHLGVPHWKNDQLPRTAGEIPPPKPKEATRPYEFPPPASATPPAASPPPRDELPARHSDPLSTTPVPWLALGTVAVLAVVVFVFARRRL